MPTVQMLTWFASRASPEKSNARYHEGHVADKDEWVEDQRRQLTSQAKVIFWHSARVNPEPHGDAEIGNAGYEQPNCSRSHRGLSTPGADVDYKSFR